MAANRTNIQVVDGSTTYTFALDVTKSGGRAFTLEQRPWEPGDPLVRWRKPLHPWDGGLATDRLGNRRVYAKANADTSFSGLLLFPPKLNDLTFTNATTPTQCVEFDGNLYVNGGRYIYKIDSSYTVTEDKDFGAAKACVSMEVFNNELICAMGEAEKIWKRTTTTWSQATDATYAIALGVVDNKLWRAASTNQVSNATTAPLTLASWTPADPNEYTGPT